ncbi:hypothetical protein [Candidatus Entotheonella palauensis]|uniref:hypothetical protein n=1 Tax=Candidatus Entotheonella palauensis TaxID=93172 RepID=UPI000B7DC56C|nr:hypothetical protein [Candidatus Entotheonella palauensis]
MANCTITLTNSGSGLLDGAISSGDEGYHYVDTFPIDAMAGGAVSNVNITNNNTVGDDPTYQNAQNVTFDNGTGILTIYPDNIRANNGTDGVVTVTYDFTVHATVPLNTETDLTDTVCSSYYDSDAGTSITSDTDCSNATITAHVTIGSFHASRERGDIVFHWTTATETANLGFNLYVVLGQTRYPLNGKLIASQVMNSTQLTSYTARIPGPVGGASSKFYIENVDMRGTTQMHGPFHISRWHGTPSLGVISEDVDWVSVQAEHDGKKRQRQAQLAQKHRQHTHHYSRLMPSGTQSERLAIKIGVSTAGVYRITYGDLAALDLNLQALDPAAIALQSGGVSIPLYVSSGDTGQFGSGSYIEFIGKPAQNLYSPENIYLLTFNREDLSTRIRSAQGAPRGPDYSSFYLATQTLTREQVYSFVSPLTNDPWHDTWLLAIDAPKTKRYRFHPDGLSSTADVGVTIDATIVGGVDWPEDREDHHVQLSLNDQLVAEQRFDGIRAVYMTAETSINRIDEHDNLVAITLPADNAQGIDAVHIDAIDIRYPRNYIARNDSLSFSSNDANFRIAGFSEPTIAVYAENRSGTIRLRHIEVASDNQGYSVAFRSAGPDSTYYVATDQSVRSASLELIERHDIAYTAADHLIIAHPDFIGPALEN